MNTYWNNMKNLSNITITTNGDKSYKSSLNGLMDMMFKAGVMHNSTSNEIAKIFIPAWQENPLWAIRLLFYIRDIRKGQGCKLFFRETLSELSKYVPHVVSAIIKYIPEYGSWNDVFILLSTNPNQEVTEKIFEEINSQLNNDLKNMKENKPISLLMKWMPSENTSSQKTKNLATKVRLALNFSPKNYRKMLSAGRKYLNIVEHHISQKTYDKIDYSIVPSKAMQKYTKCFIKNDEDHFKSFLNDIATKKTKVNAGTLYPHDIIKKLTNNTGILKNFNINDKVKLLMEEWNALPDFFKNRSDNSIVVADVSGSMTGLPMCICISLALYIAQRNSGNFHNKFITFSETPHLLEVKGNNLLENIYALSHAPWGFSTNLDAVFQLLYDAITPETKKDIPTAIYIISDMQFNNCMTNTQKTVFEKWQKGFENKGVKLPTVIFWNVSEFNSNTIPITINNTGSIVISGFSPSIINYLMSEDITNTIQLIKNIVYSNRYKNILSEDFNFNKISL